MTALGAKAGTEGINGAPLDIDDEEMGDAQVVSYCIDQLKQKHNKPLF